MRATLLAGIAIVFLVSGCDQDSNDQTQPASDGLERPPYEVAFLAAKVNVENDFDAAPNDIVKYQIRDEWRAKGVCAVLPTATFPEWVGTIKTITSDGGLVVDIGDGVTLEGDAQKGSSVYEALLKMREGDKIQFSGTFHGDTEACPFKILAWPWGDSAMKTPDFEVSFSEISEIK